MSSAGHVVAYESPICGAIRETYEELGIKTVCDDYKFICEYIDDRTFEIAQVYLLKIDINIDNLILNKDEVSEVKWLPYNEFKNLFTSSEFVPFKDDYRKIVFRLLEENFL